MMGRNDKYSHIDDFTAFGFLVNAMNGGGDRGASFPRSDAEDLSRGLRFLPGEVTVARRRGERVDFVQNCRHSCCWYWQFPDGSRTYYWERWDYEQIAAENRIKLTVNEYGSKVGEPGPCPHCGNVHTKGGRVSAEGVGR